MEKNVGQRLAVIAIVCLIAVVLLWPPSQKLRPGLDIAGGTSLIFEIDTLKAENDPNLAERVKTLLQKRVDPKGVYDLSWRVHGQNRIEVQMPLPPRDAKARLDAYREALEALYSHELTRGPVLQALRLPVEERDAALRQLAWQTAEEALARLSGPGAEARRAEIEQVAQGRERLLLAARDAYDVYMAAREARDRGPTESQPTSEPLASAPSSTAPTTEPVTVESLDRAYRDALELFEDATQEVLATNLNRRRFEEILELDAGSPVRKKSLAQIMGKHADLRDQIEEVVAKHAVWRSGKRFLESPGDLRRLLRGSGRLEFRILVEPDPGNPARYNTLRQDLATEGRTSTSDPDVAWFKVDNPMQFFNLESPAELEAFKPEESSHYVVGKFGSDYYVLAKTSPNDGLLQSDPSQRKWRLNRARPDRDEHGRWCVNFELDAVGGQMFEGLTRRNIEKPLCILVDDVAYSAPNIRSAIRTHGQISGEFSLEKVQYLVHSMEGGTLPARLKDTPLSERTVGSTLGEANRDSAVRAGLIAAGAVILVMLIYYLMCGAIANVAMLLNIFLVLAAMAMLGARINLVGIAGIVLSIGMSVDANVLIYERMREEKQRGASLRMIIKNGYDKALSTIFDSNITTLLTCVIIYYAGSEEIKGFGLTLGWGIVLNLFTAVFVTRTLFAVLQRYNLIQDVRMLKIIGVPRVDWYGKRKFFLPLSGLLILAGLGLMAKRGYRNYLDVEFLGGVAAEFGIKANPQAALDDITISRRLQGVSRAIDADARRLTDVSVAPAPDQPGAFLVRVPGVDAATLAALLAEPLEESNVLRRGGLTAQAGTDQVTIAVQAELSAEELAARIRGLAGPLSVAANDLARASVNAVLEVAGVEQEQGSTWNLTTTVTNMRLVQYALESALGDQMDVKPSVGYVFRGRGAEPFPVSDQLPAGIADDLPPGVALDLTDYLGGAAMHFDQLAPPQSVAALTARLENMHFQPDFQGLPKRRFTVYGVRPAEGRDERGNPLYGSVVVASVDPELRYADDPGLWWTGFAEGELRLVRTALETGQTLRKVMQFKPQIAGRSVQQASMALLLSWAMIIAYVWVRFGRAVYGVAGVIALVHDVLVALVFIAISGWLGNTALGRALLIEDFKINMPVIAALLTIIGFSINDTIVIFDRVRELRGRLGVVTPKVINDSVNECMSRTILTTFTVLMVVFIAYVWGGSSIRGFNYCMLIGCLSGTYSTVVIAAPLLLLRTGQRRASPTTAPARA